jgi:hypothetical protein
LLAVAIRNECDDQGVFEWKPPQLKMRLLPMDNCDIGELLSELVRNRQVTPFDYESRSYGVVRNFTRYQRPKKPNYSYILPPEFRTYVGLNGSGGELDDDKGATDGEAPDDKRPPVPKKAEKSPQMKEEGGRKTLQQEKEVRKVSGLGDGDDPPFDEVA